MHLYKNIKIIRALVNETQAEFAKRMGVSLAMQKSYELNKAKPDTLYMDRLQSISGVKIGYLLSKELGEKDFKIDVKKVEKVVARETEGIELEDDFVMFENKGTDYYREKYIATLENDRRLFESALRENLNLMALNLTELLKAQKFDRAQLSTLLLLASRTLAKIDNRNLDDVLAETNKAVNDHVALQQ